MTKVYFFKNNKYQRRTIGGGADSGYPQPASNWGAFFANGVDAAFNWGILNGKPTAVFFKGNKYVRYSIGEGVDPNYPKTISSANWGSSFSSGIDAAVNWGIVNGKPKAYFFKGNKYVRYSIGAGIDSGYPKTISNANWGSFFSGGIDAAVNWGIVNSKPKAYFFKGNQYLRWSIGEGADPGYPRTVSNANWGSFLANGVGATVNWSKHIGDIYRYFRVGYNGHSNTNAYLLAALSHLIYTGNPFGNGTFAKKLEFSAQNLSASKPFKVDVFDSGNAASYDTQAAVLSNSKVTIVVFRGSETTTDWINDFTFQLKSMPSSWGSGVRVHKGFANALHTVYEQIKQAVINNNKPIYITGHSLGGALATLCAYRLQKVNGIHVSGVYTFGAPRVGNGAFKQKYDQILFDETFRWVNKYDAAPQVPNYGPGIVALPTAYHHVGQLNYIPHNGVVMMNANDFEPSGSSSDDHAMKHYYNKMLDRLSDKQRTQVNNPSYLVQGDAPDLM